MGISLINLEKNFALDKSAYKVINCFCGAAVVGGLFLVIISPDAIKPKTNKTAGLLAWLGGLASGISLVGCGLYLRDKERLVNAIDNQQVELLHHQLSTSRVLLETQREQALVAVLEGQEPMEVSQPLPVASIPIPIPVSHTQEPIKQLPLQATDNSFEGRKQQLWELIQSDAPWLGKLLKRKPLLVVGPQGSGKTTFVKFLAMLRSLLLGHQIKVSDPHAHNNDWFDSWEVVGSQYDYKEIDRALKDYFQRLKSSNVAVTSVWDEVTNYADNCRSDESERFLKSVLADCRKSDEFPILLSHGETLGSLGGGKGGASKMKTEGLTTLKLLRKSDSMGVDTPAFRGYLSGLDYAEDGKPISYSVELNSSWMNPEYLLNLFPELLTKTDTKNEPIKSNFSPTNTPDEINLSKPENGTSLDDLENAILAFCIEKQSATVREIQTKFKSLGIKAETIKAILKGLQDRGLGIVTSKKVGGAESVSFTANSNPAVSG